jgi:glycosyltransferase involved in cell wall biosynthesis
MSAVRTVLVCEAQMPFVYGGAERHVRNLVRELRRHGYRAKKVSIPFKPYPKGELLAQAALWRLLDLSESNYERIDAVIATKFPTYCVRHPNKVTWLFHQHRAIYDLCGTPFSDFEDVEADVRLRDRLIGIDTEMLAESTRLFSNARNTAARVAKYNGLTAEPLYHPPPLAGALTAGPFGDYVLSVGRLERNKRVDLIIRALALASRDVKLIVAGEGSHRPALEELASMIGVSDRVTFTGDIDDRQLVELFANALAVVFPPLDEDYGYVTLEAFLAHKPIVTTTDAGGPLEFVVDGVNGLIAEPSAESLAAAIARLAGDRALARRLGDAGFERASLISWDGVVERLVGFG